MKWRESLRGWHRAQKRTSRFHERDRVVPNACRTDRDLTKSAMAVTTVERRDILEETSHRLARYTGKVRYSHLSSENIRCDYTATDGEDHERIDHGAIPYTNYSQSDRFVFRTLTHRLNPVFCRLRIMQSTIDK